MDKTTFEKLMSIVDAYVPEPSSFILMVFENDDASSVKCASSGDLRDVIEAMRTFIKTHAD